MTLKPYVCKRDNIITVSTGGGFSATIKLADPVTGEPLDLTDYNIVGQIRTLDGELGATFDITDTDPETGKRSFELSEEEAAKLIPAKEVQHVYGLRLTAPDGTRLREIQGGCMVVQDVVVLEGEA